MIITIMGGVALLLYGVRQVRYGITRAYGVELRHIIERSTRTKIGAFFAGLIVTAMVQSSTATSLILTSFASRKLISVAAALAVILGADVGTTLIAQVFSFNIGWLAPFLVAAGVIGYSVKGSGRGHHISVAIIGLGLMVLSLDWIVHASEPIGNSALLKQVMTALAQEPLLALLLSALLTWAAHSSLATILLVMSLASTGALTLPVALMFVLGANIGGAIPPLILNLREGGNGRVVAIGSFSMRAMGALVVAPFIPYMADMMMALDDNAARQVVNFHTLYNLARGIVLLPFTGVIAKYLIEWMPLVMAEPDDEGNAEYIDYDALDTPSVALPSAAREVLRMGDIVEDMLCQVVPLLSQQNDRAIMALQKRDDIVDRLHEQVKLYMAKLSAQAMDPDQSQRYMQILMFSTNLEHIGDIIVKNLCELARKRLREGISFSDEGIEEIRQYHQLVLTNFGLSMDVFMTNDAGLARQLIINKEVSHKQATHTSDSHFDRIRAGLSKTLQSSTLHLDIIRDLKQINSHITAGAYSLMEEKGELQSRLKTNL